MTKASKGIFRAPLSVLIICAAILIIQLCVGFLAQHDVHYVYVYGALFPARLLDASLTASSGLPGGLGLSIGNLFSYGLLHGGWSHVIINSVWLLAFGTPVARRIGNLSFMIFFFVCIALAGLGQALATPDASYLVPIVGASGGVSALMGAASRFAFSPRHRNAVWPEHPRLLSVTETLRQPTILAFIGVWFAINLMVGLLGPFGFASPDGQPVSVAYIAHIAGFVAGFFLLPLFDRLPMSPSGGPGNVDYGSWKDE